MNAETAHHLRGYAITWLRQNWPEAVIVPELSVASWGHARVDVAAVTEKELIGVEIKGEGDSTARLSLQGMQYSSVCSRMFLLPCAALRDKCVAAKPPGWLMATNSDGEWWSNTDKRGDGQPGFGSDYRPLPISPIRLVDMLWAAELHTALEIHGIFVPQKKAGGGNRAKTLAEELPLKVLQPTVYWLLHRRRWEQGMYPKQVWRPDGVLAAS